MLGPVQKGYSSQCLSGKTPGCYCFAPGSKTIPWEYEQNTLGSEKEALTSKHTLGSI